MATSVPCTLLEDLSNALPPLAESIVAFTTTLASVVDKIVEYFDNEENSRHVAETTHEARTLCQQLLQIMILSDSYMDDVDTFAELAIDKRRQGEIVAVLRQDRIPQFEPMSEYILQLRHSLNQAKDSHTIFEEAGITGVIEKLESVLVKNAQNVSGAEKMKTKILVTGGVGGIGAGAGVGAGLALVAPPAAAVALAGVIVLGIAAGMYSLAKEQAKVIEGIKALSKLVSLIAGIANAIKLIVLEVQKKMNSVSGQLNEILNFESMSSLMYKLESLFRKLNTVGQTCLDCQQKLKEKKQRLETTIDKLLNC